MASRDLPKVLSLIHLVCSYCWLSSSFNPNRYNLTRIVECANFSKAILLFTDKCYTKKKQDMLKATKKTK